MRLIKNENKLVTMTITIYENDKTKLDQIAKKEFEKGYKSKRSKIIRALINNQYEKEFKTEVKNA